MGPPASPASEGPARTLATATGASAQHLLAMKLVAGRFKDRGDIAVLCKALGVGNEDEAMRIKDQVLPGVPLHRAAREALKRVFEDREIGYER